MSIFVVSPFYLYGFYYDCLLLICAHIIDQRCYSQLFLEAFAPQLFCYPIRRKGHVPEGTLSIEYKQSGSEMTEAIRTGA
jgi:hypothetical protein